MSVDLPGKLDRSCTYYRDKLYFQACSIEKTYDRDNETRLSTVQSLFHLKRMALDESFLLEGSFLISLHCH